MLIIYGKNMFFINTLDYSPGDELSMTSLRCLGSEKSLRGSGGWRIGGEARGHAPLSEGGTTPFVDYIDTLQGGTVLSEGGVTPFMDCMLTVGRGVVTIEGGMTPQRVAWYLRGRHDTSEGGMTPQRAALFFLRVA